MQIPRRIIRDSGRNFVNAIPFENAAQRNRRLMAGGGGRFMNMGAIGEDSSPSWSAGLLEFAKSAAGLVNDQRAFNQQLNVAKQSGVPVQMQPAPQVQHAPLMQDNTGRMIMLAAAGLLGVVLFKSVTSRR